MGYYTYHTVTSDSRDGEQEEKLFDMLRELSGYTNDAFDGCESSKWYDCDEHMTELSAEFPGVTIRVDGVGEDAGDVWVKWYLDGTCIGTWHAPDINIPAGFEPPRSEA